MTQIVDLSSTNWFHDLQKAIYEFEQENGVQPHLYANPAFFYRCVELLENIIWIKNEEDNGSKSGEFMGCSIEMDYAVDADVVILKA